MKRKQKDELRAKGVLELKEEVLKKEDEVMRLKFEVQTAKAKDTTSIRRKMDELAILKTMIKEKEFEKEVSLTEEIKK